MYGIPHRARQGAVLPRICPEWRRCSNPCPIRRCDVVLPLHMQQYVPDAWFRTPLSASPRSVQREAARCSFSHTAEE